MAGKCASSVNLTRVRQPTRLSLHSSDQSMKSVWKSGIKWGQKIEVTCASTSSSSSRKSSMLSLTAWPDLRGLGSLKARDGSTHQYGNRKHEAEANPSGVAPARTQPTRAALRGRGGKALVRARGGGPRAPVRAPSRVPAYHPPSEPNSEPLPQPHTSGTRREAYRHARASAGRTSGGGCAGASERGVGGGSRGGGERRPYLDLVPVDGVPAAGAIHLRRAAAVAAGSGGAGSVRLCVCFPRRRVVAARRRGRAVGED